MLINIITLKIEVEYLIGVGEFFANPNGIEFFADIGREGANEGWSHVKNVNNWS